MSFDISALSRAAAAVRTRPFTLSVSSVIVAAQGLVIFGLGGFLVWSALFGNPDSRVGAVLMGILCLIGGGGLLMCGSGLWRMRRWSRSPALVWQLLTIPVGLYQLRGSLWVTGIPVIALAVIAALLLAVPRTAAALAD